MFCLFIFPEDNQLIDKVLVGLKKYFDLCSGMNENDPHRVIYLSSQLVELFGKD